MGVCIAYVSWDAGGKTRTVLVIGQSASGVTVFAIITQYAGKSEAARSKFFKINDWRQAGLNQESCVDTNATVSLPHSL